MRNRKNGLIPRSEQLEVRWVLTGFLTPGAFANPILVSESAGSTGGTGQSGPGAGPPVFMSFNTGDGVVVLKEQAGAGFSYPDPTAPPGSAANPIYGGLIGGGGVAGYPVSPDPNDPIAIPVIAGSSGGTGQAGAGAGLALNTPAARYVDKLFVADLGRAPTQADLTFWTGVVRRSGIASATRVIAATPEAKLHRA